MLHGVGKKIRLFLFSYFFSESDASKMRFWLGGGLDAFFSDFVVFNLRSQFDQRHLQLQLSSLSCKLRVRHEGFCLKLFWDERLVGGSSKNDSLQKYLMTMGRYEIYFRRISACMPANIVLKKEKFDRALQYIAYLFDCYEINSADACVFHGNHPLLDLAREFLRVQGVRTVFSEYGELPNTMMLSERTLFHDSWPRVEKDFFHRLPLKRSEFKSAARILDKIIEGNRLHDHRTCEANDDKGFAVDPGKFSAVVYVNGIEPILSGLFPRSAQESKRISPWFMTNQHLLDHVAEIAERHNFLVLYKDHPGVFSSGRRRVESDSRFVRVIDKNIGLYEILDIADVMVSLSSKSIIFALLKGVPVCIPGTFTIPADLTPGVYEGLALERNLLTALSFERNARVDKRLLYEFLARLLRFYLYPVDHLRGSLTAFGYRSPYADLYSYVTGERKRVSVAD